MNSERVRSARESGKGTFLEEDKGVSKKERWKGQSRENRAHLPKSNVV